MPDGLDDVTAAALPNPGVSAWLAGAAISLPAAVLRSTALTILGTAGIPPRDVLVDALQKVVEHGTAGELGMETERVALADIENAWNRDQRGRRFVVIP